MKLLTKLSLFITLSKIVIVILFIGLLPTLVSKVSFQYTNYSLTEQKKKVLAAIARNGIDAYLQGDSAYGSYTMLKEEYISLSPAGGEHIPDTIETSRRIVDNDTLDYRVLTHALEYGHKRYLLEIGKTTATIGQYSSLLQRFTLYALIFLIALSIAVDLIYTHYLIQPLGRIVRTKLLNSKFPFAGSLSPVRTSTSDFRYLDSSLISLMDKIHEAFEKEREFTSNASHELMTPISILQTNIENMMVDEDISESQQDKITAMMKTLNRLKKIVHALLYISRIENEQFIKKDTVNIRGLIAEVMEELGHRLEMRSIRFTNEVSSGPTLQHVNRDLLFQLLYNLINNAVKYNKEGGSITITDRYYPGQPYTLSVKDTGIGIREEGLATLFDRFKKTGQKDTEGYGLGLSIVKSIVLYHGAAIAVHSEWEKGSEFRITFASGTNIV